MSRIEKMDVNVPIVIQSIGGGLRLKGRDDTTLIVDGENPQVAQIGEGQPYVVNCGGDCRIIAPQHVSISVLSVGGDAKITDLEGKFDIQSVGGDLTLRSVHTAKVKSVGGDLRIKLAGGDVSVENVGSDATVREIGGAVWIAHVGSDLYLRNVESGCVVEQVGSDLVLSIDFQPDLQYRFNAGGDILCRIYPDTDARFILPTETQLQLDVPADLTEDENEGVQIVTLGSGSATIHITGAEGLRLVGEEEDYMINLGVQIEEEIDARMASLEDRLSEQLAGLDEQIQTRAKLFASQAEKFAERAARQAERAAERVRRSLADRPQTTRRKRGLGFSARFEPGSASRPTAEPVSEQERLMILKMVQDNKITIEEAERLLAALEGPKSQQR